MSIRDALIAAIASLYSELIADAKALLTARQTGPGGLLWSEFRKIFLSLREEFSDYTDPLNSDPTHIGMILAIEKDAINIHKKRGSAQGLVPDIKRLCNSAGSSVVYHGQDEVGWILGYTSPGFTGHLGGTLVWDPTDSLSVLGLDNMLDVETDNKSGRSTAEVEQIIRHEFVPLKLNCRFFIPHP